MKQGRVETNTQRKSLDDVVSSLSEPDNAKALEDLVEALPSIRKAVTLLAELDRIGALDTLFSLSCALANSKSMLSDEMVAGAASLGSSAIELLAKLSSPELQGLLSVVFDHSVELSQAMTKAPRVKGVIGLMKEIRDPDVQKGLGALFAFLRLFGRYAKPASDVNG